ncbi:ABC transporter, ATP-binding protein [Clostridium bornimense]|uniref:ABC transporter, ATP-binding protein n=1 Tax=Clostridium bornimense TaxID=1216932 RepID=W6SKG1_9CLOT|nr:ATP-binding cassette domain-containing protein [Clostridium bornimense]CDM70355.1 ABC transporter, ATP-binding protein [Clostridium bornimense]
MDIVLKKVCKSYNNEIILKDYDYVFKENQITYIKGKSGSGKTTLLRVLMGFESIDKGTIEGIDNKRISTVFQEDRLCENLSVMANIKLVSSNLNDSNIEEALDKVGMKDCKNKPAKELSGGMKRRAAILRALLYEFDLLILDEPFKGLDINTKKSVINFIKQKIKDKTVIIVTHDMEELDYFNGLKINICDFEKLV